MARFTGSLFALTAAFVSLRTRLTIYQPAPTDPALQAPTVNDATIIGVAPIAVQSDGATLYGATEVATALVLGETTLSISPSTFVATFEEGASTYHFSQATTTTILGHAIAVNEDLSCGPGNGNNLNCVAEGEVSIEGATATGTTVTFAASQSPIFTITSSIGPLPTGKSGAVHVAPFTAAMSLFAGFLGGVVYVL
ncbi:hypothetical protein BDN70DRAFT_881439 [Pholiota conissans]|uniref:Uncharacterized protein n=1 Tax=Pholiota conissans TaxID=109636 RepID=A0A9P6CZ24_9AGAR|nr:hypothetical protein BDN70DRAFT_881439 [Pholiota conissans]